MPLAEPNNSLSGTAEPNDGSSAIVEPNDSPSSNVESNDSPPADIESYGPSPIVEPNDTSSPAAVPDDRSSPVTMSNGSSVAPVEPNSSTLVEADNIPSSITESNNMSSSNSSAVVETPTDSPVSAQASSKVDIENANDECIVPVDTESSENRSVLSEPKAEGTIDVPETNSTPVDENEIEISVDVSKKDSRVTETRSKQIEPEPSDSLLNSNITEPSRNKSGVSSEDSTPNKELLPHKSSESKKKNSHSGDDVPAELRERRRSSSVRSIRGVLRSCCTS